MTTQDRVCWAWKEGTVDNAGALRTAGGRLYSYQLLIGDTIDGDAVAFDYTAKGGAFESVTTSKHVEAAKRRAARVEVPNV